MRMTSVKRRILTFNEFKLDIESRPTEKHA